MIISLKECGAPANIGDFHLQMAFIWQGDTLAEVDLKLGISNLFVDGSNMAIEQTRDWLKNYFQGRHLPLPYKHEGTAFQKQVLDQMAKIPFGSTISYSELAKRAGNDKAVRAAGTVCRKNPVPLLIPCHRVIAKDATLGGFSKGSSIKVALLNLEKQIIIAK